ncbi:MAG TPA: ATP-binding cassette domain-containing protein [Oculatellaceae cyanobacterium]
MIELKNVSKTYDGGKTFSVKELNLTVDDNEFLVFLGSSGSGKSTTLKMINRLIEPSHGSIFLDGKSILELDIVQLRRSIGYVFQGIGLFPHMTIFENVSIVPKLLGWTLAKRIERAKELLDLVGLPFEKFSERLPEQLSGGQQQRIGVARALAADPKCLLMDEPFGALDAVTRDKLQQELLSLQDKLGKTFIFVTHDLFEALTLGDRIAIFDDGVMQQVGSKEEVMKSPATDFVRELFARPAKQLRDFQGML